MPKRGIFGSYEEEFSKTASGVISEVKEQLPLDEYLRAQSVTNNSVNNINNYDAYNSSFDSGYSNGNSMGNFEVKQKTLVRKMNTPYGYSSSTPQVDNSYSQQYMGGSSFDSVSGNDMWNNRTGSAQTLVLIMTAILVVLVVTVSLVVMNYMGI